MRVVEAISDSNIGGAGILLITRLKCSDRKSIHSTVVLPKGSALKERLNGIGVQTFEIENGQDRSFDVRAIMQYRTLLRRLRPDLVNCHGVLSCRIAARLCRVPVVVYTRHCAYPLSHFQRSFPGKCFVGMMQNLLSDGMIAVADAAKKNLTDMGADFRKIHVIINGVEGIQRRSPEEKRRIREKLNIPQRAFVVGICARLEPCKGHKDFLRAAELLIAKSKRYRFLIVGDGSLKERLTKLCKIRGLDPYVIFTGFAEDVSIYYSIMDLNVNCSVGTETSSLALSEGMSLSLPAVVSDYGGNPYMVRHGQNGLVYPTGRADLLAGSILRISTDHTLYQKMSQNAYERFLSELNAEHMTEKTERLYQALFLRYKDRIKSRE